MYYWEFNYECRSEKDKNLFWRFTNNRHVRETYIVDGKLRSSIRETVSDNRGYGYMGDADFYRKCLKYIVHNGKTLPWNHFFLRVGEYCEGMTVREALKFVMTHERLFKEKPQEREKMKGGFIVNVKRPEVRRAEGNKNPNTFDFVRVELILKSMDVSERDKLIKEKMRDLVDYALDSISEDKRYMKYGVPVNYLKPYSVGVHGSVLFLDFELKAS